MPNRFSKAFRRRSSGGISVLQYEEAPNTSSEGTFRVLHRTQSELPQAFTNTTRKTDSSTPYLRGDRRPRSYGDGSDASYKGSGDHSNSTANTHVSHRLSYSSTNPSSVDVHDVPPLKGQTQPYKSMQAHPLPPEPQYQQQQQQRAPHSSFSLKNAGRAFSFGTRSSKQNAAEARQERDRALTASSYASTTTPPKLDLGETNVGSSDFGSLFAGRNGSAVMHDVPPVPPLPQGSTEYDSNHPLPDMPPPRRPSSPSGYSWTSNQSAEKLMSSPRQRPDPGESPHFLSEFGGNADSQLIMESLYGANGSSSLDPARDNQTHGALPPRHIPDRTIQRAKAGPSALGGSRNLVSPPPVRRYVPPAASIDEDGFSSVPLTSSRSPPRQDGDDEPLFDAPRVRRPFRPLGRESTMTKRITRNKIMTPAEFEEAKKRRDLGIKNDDEAASSSSSSEDDAYEDEDETEKTKNLARQRRRQEAQLTVYRQQMMKVTGEPPSDLPEMNPARPAILQRSANSAPSMLGALPWEGKDKDAQANAANGGKSSDEEEDEDVPLGVLQAHGFPNKVARPPTRLSSATSNGLQSASESNLLRNYPIPHGATRNDSTAGGGGNPNLPVFAKNLPQDPYVGAGLVASGRREAVGMGSEAPGPGGVPPGGLVGIIAGEERARALRRGSPNTGGTYDPVAPSQLPMEVHEQMMRQQMMGQGGRPMSGSDQAQMQVNNSMMHMMQVQMQWMQQMMQMQGIQPPPMPMMPGMPGMAGMPGMPGMPVPDGSFMGHDPSMRPLSQASFGGHQSDGGAMNRGPAPSTYGGLAPSSAQSVFGMQGPGPGYAGSVAPSERSVAGQPSRYRPVTPNQGASQGTSPNQHSRSSTMSATTVQPTGIKGKRSQSRLRTESTDDLRKSTISMQSSSNSDRPAIKAVNRPKVGRASQEDDDDEQAWADMARRREARKSKWRANKGGDGQNGFPGEHEGLEGLYYEG